MNRITTNDLARESEGIKEDTITVCLSQIDSNKKPQRYNLYYKINIGRSTETLEILESEYEGRSKKKITDFYKESYPECYSSSGTTTCNSLLFSIGGDSDCLDITSESRNEVFTYKLSGPSHRWEPYPATLNARRHNPLIITIQNDIYVFGTVNYPSGDLDPFAEVIHTQSKTIEPLKAQPPKWSICAGFILCSAVIRKKGETVILLATSDHCYNGPTRLLFYYVEKGCWEDVTEAHPNFFSIGARLSVRSAVIDGVLYTYCSKNVYAYDLDNGKWFDRPVLSLLEEEKCYYKFDNDKGFVLDLGNEKLCVGFCTSFPEGEEGEKPKVLLQYALFQPQIDSKVCSKERAHTIIRAEVHSKGYHVLYGMHLVDAVIMQRTQVLSQETESYSVRPITQTPMVNSCMSCYAQNTNPMVNCAYHQVGRNKETVLRSFLKEAELPGKAQVTSTMCEKHSKECYAIAAKGLWTIW